MDICPLADCADHWTDVADLMQAVWPEYYGSGGQGDALQAVRARGTGDPLPFGFAAFDATGLIGTVAVEQTSHGALPDELPWLNGLAVTPMARGRGVATALVERAMQEAARRGFPRLYATTMSADALLRRIGWEGLRPIDGGLHVLSVTLPPRKRPA